MSKIKDYIKKEKVFFIAFIAAAVSVGFVPPDGEYLSYFDLRTLALLYCLMVVVSGLRGAGFFSYLAHSLCSVCSNARTLGTVLVLLCFFSSMLVTNDVALLTFVPFAVVVLGMAHESKMLVLVVVLQTVAANLGSMLTPVGNPQNLYLYSRYSMTLGDFFSATLPVWLVSLALILALCFVLPRAKVSIYLGEAPSMDARSLGIYTVLFAVALLVVFRLISWVVMLCCIVGFLIIYDRKMLLHADFALLATFICFFIFSGNLARIDAVNAFLRSIVSGRELIAGVAASQVISNVPAALLLSGFTDNARSLLLGVDIGGLGTPVASLASLISLKLYSHSEHSGTGRFMLLFSAVNILFLAVLLLIFA